MGPLTRLCCLDVAVSARALTDANVALRREVAVRPPHVRLLRCCVEVRRFWFSFRARELFGVKGVLKVFFGFLRE